MAAAAVAAAQQREVGGSLAAALSSSGERGRRGTRRRREEGTIVCRRAVPLRHRPAGGRRRGDMRPGRERARSGPSSRPGEGDTRRELPTGGGGEGTAGRVGHPRTVIGARHGAEHLRSNVARPNGRRLLRREGLK